MTTSTIYHQLMATMLATLYIARASASEELKTARERLQRQQSKFIFALPYARTISQNKKAVSHGAYLFEQQFRSASLQCKQNRQCIRAIKQLNTEILEDDSTIEQFYNQLYYMTIGYPKSPSPHLEAILRRSAMPAFLTELRRSAPQAPGKAKLKAHKRHVKQAHQAIIAATLLSELEDIRNNLEKQYNKLKRIKEKAFIHNSKQQSYLQTIIYHISLVQDALPKSNPLRLKDIE